MAAVVAVVALFATFGCRPGVEEGVEPPAAIDDQAPAADEVPASQEAASPDEAADEDFPDPWQDPTTGMRFRYIPAGSFTMGSPESEEGRFENETQHEVTLTRAFWIGETEVTQEQWRRVMETDPSKYASCGDQCPVEQVSWYEAVTFANRLSQLSGLDRCYELSGCEGTQGGGCDPSEGLGYYCKGDYWCATVKLTSLDCRGYRLPTEAEWEYAARAGTETALYTGPLTLQGDCIGPELDELGWYCGNSGESIHAVGQKKPSGWGLYDILGNAWEWTGDWYGEYETTPSTDPLGPAEGDNNRVIRGGSWRNFARHCRTSYRLIIGPRYRFCSVGIRLVRIYP